MVAGKSLGVLISNRCTQLFYFWGFRIHMKSAIMFHHFALVSLMAPPPPRYHRHYGHPPLPTAVPWVYMMLTLSRTRLRSNSDFADLPEREHSFADFAALILLSPNFLRTNSRESLLSPAYSFLTPLRTLPASHTITSSSETFAYFIRIERTLYISI
jgi:hypothetical protein